MASDFTTALRRAASLTRAYNLVEATREIQAALQTNAAGDAPQSSWDREEKPDPVAAFAVQGGFPHGLRGWRQHGPETVGSGAGAAVADALQLSRPRRSLGETIRALAANGKVGQWPTESGRQDTSPPVPAGALYLSRTFSCPAGTRSYRLYVPQSAGEQPNGLILMLHGCKQNSDDFAIGTGMNEVAEKLGLIIAYPEQTLTANASGCWNWFNPADQGRGRGEPAILAGLADALAAEFRIPAGRIFAAGLSAGGAMAAILADSYPDVFSAVGIHSGLAAGSASDVVSAFAAMRGGRTATPSKPKLVGGTHTRLIVFHGTADQTVHPRNADEIIASVQTDSLTVSRHEGRTPAGVPFSRTCYLGADDAAALELWLVSGAGHAWSGGRPDGSFTNPQGPDASVEMGRFFLNGFK